MLKRNSGKLQHFVLQSYGTMLKARNKNQRRSLEIFKRAFM